MNIGNTYKPIEDRNIFVGGSIKTGGSALAESKCIDLNMASEYMKMYSIDSYIERVNAGSFVTILNNRYAKFAVNIIFSYEKFGYVYDSISSGDKKMILFNKDFNGLVTSISKDDSNGTFCITIETYSFYGAVGEQKSRLVLDDNAFVIINDTRLIPVATDSPISRIEFSSKTATYGVFGSIYNMTKNINIELAEVRTRTEDSLDVIASILNGDVYYVDVANLSRKTLIIVNPIDFSIYTGTINTKDSEFAKFFYIANINKEIIKESNSLKFNIKASLI